MRSFDYGDDSRANTVTAWVSRGRDANAGKGLWLGGLCICKLGEAFELADAQRIVLEDSLPVNTFGASPHPVQFPGIPDIPRSLQPMGPSTVKDRP